MLLDSAHNFPSIIFDLGLAAIGLVSLPPISWALAKVSARRRQRREKQLRKERMGLDYEFHWD